MRLYCFYENPTDVKSFFCIFAKFKVNKMNAKKILFINQEIAPYVADSELSLMGKRLPQAVLEKGYEIRTFMPKWGNINERRGQLHEVIRLSRMMIIFDDTDHPLIIKVASIPSTRIQVYFIDNDDYFTKRLMAADENGEEYEDNGERAIFFARGVLETIKKLHWTPDIIHCQGWMGSVIPFYVKTAYKDEPSFANAKIVTSLFGNGLKKDIEPTFRQCLEFKDAKGKVLDKYNKKFDFTEFQKFAIDYSDGIVEAGPGVSPELIEYARAKGMPLMSTTTDGDIDADAYDKFYDQVFGDSQNV